MCTHYNIKQANFHYSFNVDANFSLNLECKQYSACLKLALLTIFYNIFPIFYYYLFLKPHYYYLYMNTWLQTAATVFKNATK